MEKMRRAHEYVGLSIRASEMKKKSLDSFKILKSMKNFNIYTTEYNICNLKVTCHINLRITPFINRVTYQ
jgi:hypothetical protein